jgi:hypothetical protein
MSQLADDLAASGNSLHDEFVAYLLAGLDEDYNSIFTSVASQADAIAPTELYAQLLCFEQHTSLQGHSAHGGSLSAMTASYGHGFLGWSWPWSIFTQSWAWPWPHSAWWLIKPVRPQCRQLLYDPAPMPGLFQDQPHRQEVLVPI